MGLCCLPIVRHVASARLKLTGLFRPEGKEVDPYTSRSHAEKCDLSIDFSVGSRINDIGIGFVQTIRCAEFVTKFNVVNLINLINHQQQEYLQFTIIIAKRRC